MRTERRALQGESKVSCQPWKEYLSRQRVNISSLSGEPFTEEEMEEMLSNGLDPETNTVHYRDYISMMIVEEPEDLPQ